ncbi:MAG TPA: hypothetical protein VFS21_34990 [Roseiflexaceae bacterium]|nr:hypothetical protein [Roseiflexaceae bacterium]
MTAHPSLISEVIRAAAPRGRLHTILPRPTAAPARTAPATIV